MSDQHPIVIDLEPDTYYWCSCGKTKNQPFCDGSHEGTNFLPIEFTITEKKQMTLTAMVPMKIFRSLVE